MFFIVHFVASMLYRPAAAPPFPLFIRTKISSESTLFSFKSPTAGAKDIRFKSVAADFALNLNSTDPKLAAAVRRTLLPELLLGFVSTFLVLGRLRKLCARCARGEVFSEANLRSTRSLGLILVVTGIAGIGFHFWNNHHLIAYVNEHVTIAGIGAGVSAGSALNFYWIGSLFAGPLVMVLIEVFRQGLALQKENELTV